MTSTQQEPPDADSRESSGLNVTVSPGRALPLGSSIRGQEINFAVFSRR